LRHGVVVQVSEIEKLTKKQNKNKSKVKAAKVDLVGAKAVHYIKE